MPAEIIEGKPLADKIKTEIRTEISKLYKAGYRQAKLVVILVGEDQASKTYIKNKTKACAYCYLASENILLPEDTSKEELEETIQELNADPNVDGILLQLPLPKKLNKYKNYFISLIKADKDVDGFNPLNIGKLNLGIEAPKPCTPSGIIKLLEASKQDLCGKNALIIGRSNVVGKPLIQMLLNKDCTVTIAHSKTKDLKTFSLLADIVVVSVGKAGFLKADMVKEGAIIIDVGINRDQNNKLVGDVDFAEVAQKASFITPVPGGVGAMTVAMLMSNSLLCYKKHLGLI